MMVFLVHVLQSFIFSTVSNLELSTQPSTPQGTEDTDVSNDADAEIASINEPGPSRYDH